MVRHLSHCVRELGAAIAERQGALAVALEGSRSRKEEALAAQLAGKRSLLEHAGLMVYTQELLKETDVPCFVQASRITHRRWRHGSVWGWGVGGPHSGRFLTLRLRLLPPQVSESHREAPAFLPGDRALLQALPLRCVQRGEAHSRLGVHTR